MMMNTVWLPLLWLLFAAVTSAHAQWAQTSGPEGGTLMSAMTDGDSMVAISVEGRIHRFIDGRWHDVGSTGIGAVSGIIKAGGGFVGRGSQGIVRSTDGGLTWTTTLPGWGAVAPRSDGAVVVAGLADTLFLSRDGGSTWEPAIAGVSVGSTMAIEGEHLYVNNGFFLYRYRHAAGGGVAPILVDSMQPVMEGSVSFIVDIVLRNDTLYAATIGAGIQRSIDSGRTWNAMNQGIPVDSNQTLSFASLRFEGEDLWAIDQRGELFRFLLGTWKTTPLGVYAYTYVRTPIGVIAMTAGEPVRLDEASGTWIAMTSGMKGLSTTEMAAIPEGLIVSGSSALYRTTNAGATWEEIAPFGASRLAVGNGVVYALAAGGYHTYGRVVRSFDNGTTWETIDDRLPEPLSAGAAVDIESDGDEVAVALSETFSFHGNSRWVNGGVIRSTDRGHTWRDASSGLPDDGFTHAPVTSLVLTDNGMFVSTVVGLYRSSGRAGGWSAAGSNGLPVSATGSVQAWIAEAHQGRILARSVHRLHISENNGASWRAIYEADSAAGESLSETSLVGDVVYALINRWDGLRNTYRLLVIAFDGSVTDITGDLPEGTTLTRFTIADGHIFAGSHGRSVWSSPLPPASVGAEEERSLFPDIAVIPNPSSSTSILHVDLKTPTSVRVSIVDHLGRQVVNLPQTFLPSGRRTILLDGSFLPRGLYIVRITTDAQTQITTWTRM